MKNITESVRESDVFYDRLWGRRGRRGATGLDLGLAPPVYEQPLAPAWECDRHWVGLIDQGGLGSARFGSADHQAILHYV